MYMLCLITMVMDWEMQIFLSSASYAMISAVSISTITSSIGSPVQKEHSRRDPVV